MTIDIVSAKIIDVTESDKYKNIVILGTRYDRGLQKEVECSVQIGVSTEHHHLLAKYKSLIGQHVYLPVNLWAGAKGIFRLTAGDGLPLNIKSV